MWFLVLLGGCGGESGREVPPIPPLPETPAAEVAEPPESQAQTVPTARENPARVESLRARLNEARERLNALPALHREEMKKLGDLSALRAQERKLIVGAKQARSQIEYYEKRQGPVDPEVEALAVEAETLQARCDRLEEELDERRRATAQV
ncbi:MAG: coiled-coil domain-containing protein, partial [Planctomycetota bacterium]